MVRRSDSVSGRGGATAGCSHVPPRLYPGNHMETLEPPKGVEARLTLLEHKFAELVTEIGKLAACMHNGIAQHPEWKEDEEES